jgi:aryl-alcohol dehydrogenase-like predicted oxidoreductase
MGETKMKLTRRSAIALAAMTGMAWTARPAFAADKRRVGKSIGSSFPFSGADLAKAKGVTPSQLALAWVMAKGDYIVPIPGTRRRKYLEDNAGAASVSLSAADLAEIDAAFPQGVSVGARYGGSMAGALNG